MRLVTQVVGLAACAAVAVWWWSSSRPPAPRLDAGELREIRWLTRDGLPAGHTAAPAAPYERLWLEAGDSAALARIAGNDGLWRVDLESGELTLATTSTRPAPDDATPAPDGALSADGRWLAYATAEAGVPEVYVTTFPGADVRWLVSPPPGGTHPVWREDSQQLYYWAPGGRLMMAPLQRGRRFVEPGLPSLLFERPDLAGAPFAVTRDALRFLVAVPR